MLTMVNESEPLDLPTHIRLNQGYSEAIAKVLKERESHSKFVHEAIDLLIQKRTQR